MPFLADIINLESRHACEFGNGIWMQRQASGKDKLKLVEAWGIR